MLKRRPPLAPNTVERLAKLTIPKTLKPSILAVLVAGACVDVDPVAELGYELHRTLPHDPDAYTQGLLLRGGSFFESTGLLGKSELREVEIATGEVLRSRELADTLFGEGLAMVGDKLVQLTWKAGLAFVYDAETFSLENTFEYSGEGWGLCYDGQFLYMTDGTSALIRRHPETFEVLEELRVTRDGFSVHNLNELECVEDGLWANQYTTNGILRIDKQTGEVTGRLDVHGLSLASDRPSDPGAVLNGIAYDPSTKMFYVTGKLWPKLFEISISGE